jgi:hypothetical protein
MTIAGRLKQGNLMIASAVNERLPLITNGLIASYPFDGNDRMCCQNLLKNSSVEVTSSNEYTSVNITSVAQQYLGKTITISVDIKANKAGTISFYALGGYKVGFSVSKPIGTGYTRISATGTFSYVANDPNGDVCALSFYGTYGSGLITTVKNVKIELGSMATNWCPHITETNNVVSTNSTFMPYGVAVERGTTNLVPFPFDPMSTYYGLTALGWTYIKNPDNVKQVAKYTVGTSDGRAIRASQVVPIVVGQTYTMSAIMKHHNSNNGADFYISAAKPFPEGGTVTWNVTEGAPTIISLGDGWYKIVRSITINATERSQAVLCYGLSTYDNTPGKDYFYIYNVQFENTNYSTAYTPNTRSTGILKLPKELIQPTGSISFDFMPETFSGQDPIFSTGMDGGTDLLMQSNAAGSPSCYWRFYSSSTASVQKTGNWFPNLYTWYNVTMTWTNNGDAKLYINGVNVSTMSPCGDWYNYFLVNSPGFYLGSGIRGVTGFIFKNLYVYNRVLSDIEVQKMIGNKFHIDTTGTVITKKTVEMPNSISSDSFYFPLSLNGKDSNNNIGPSLESGLIYEKGSVWVGPAETNLAPRVSLMDIDPGVTRTSVNTPGIVPRCPVYKIDITGGPENRNVYKYITNIACAVGDIFVLRGWFKALNTPISNFHICVFATGGEIVNSYTTLGTEWQYIEGILTITNASSTTLNAFEFGLNAGSSNINCSFLTQDLVLEKVPFRTPYTFTTKADGKLKYTFSSMNIDVNNNPWTVAIFASTNNYLMQARNYATSQYARIPVFEIGDYYRANQTSLTFLHNGADANGFSTVIYDNQVSKSSPSSLTLTSNEIGQFILYALSFDGTNLNHYIIGSNGFRKSSLTKNWTNPIADIINVGSYGWSGNSGSDSTTFWNGYMRDLIVVKRALTDSELQNIFNLQMSSKPDKLQISNQLIENATL